MPLKSYQKIDNRVRVPSRKYIWSYCPNNLLQFQTAWSYQKIYEKGLYYSYNFRSNFCNFLIQCPILSKIEVHLKPKSCISLNIQKNQTYKSVSHWAAEYKRRYPE